MFQTNNVSINFLKNKKPIKPIWEFVRPDIVSMGLPPLEDWMFSASIRTRTAGGRPLSLQMRRLSAAREPELARAIHKIASKQGAEKQKKVSKQTAAVTYTVCDVTVRALVTYQRLLASRRKCTTCLHQSKHSLCMRCLHV